MAEVADRPAPPTTDPLSPTAPSDRQSGARHPVATAGDSARSSPSTPPRPPSSSSAAGTRGASFGHGRCGRRRVRRTVARAGRTRSASCCATDRRRSACCSACCAPAAAWSRSTRTRGATACATTSPASTFVSSSATRPTSRSRWCRTTSGHLALAIAALGTTGASTVGADRTPGRHPARRRGADAHERHHRAAEAGRPHLRDARAGARRREALRDASRRQRRAPARRRRHRQLAARPPRRALPGAAVRDRRPVVLAARAVHRRRLGRRRAPPPARDGQPRARRAAHGARRRPRSGRPRAASGRSSPAPRRSTRTTPTPSPRSTACPCSSPTRPPSSAAASPAGTSPTTRRYWADKRGSVGRAHPGCELRVVDEATGAALGPDERPARGAGRPARRRPAGSAPPTSPASTPTASSGSSAAPTRRSSAAGSRCSPTTCAAALERHPAVRGAAVVGVDDAAPRRGARRRRRAHATRRRVDEAEPARRTRAVLARYEIPAEIRFVDDLPRTDSAKVDLGAVRALATRSPREQRADVDLRYSDDRRGLPRRGPRVARTTRCPRHGPPPAARRLAGPPRLRHRLAAQAPRRRLRRARTGRTSTAAAACPVTQQLVYLEEYAGQRRPYISVNFVGMMHAGPTLIAEGTDEQRRLPPAADPQGETVWCQGFSEPEAGSDLASLRTRAVRDGDEYVVIGPEDLEHPGPRRRLLRAAGAHRSRRAEAQGHHLADPRHAPARHRGATDAGRSTARATSARSSSTRCGCRSPTGWAQENDGWRVTNVTLRFERGTAFAQHIITLRSQLRRLVALAGDGRGDAPRGTTRRFRRQVGRLDASIEALWRMTQRCVDRGRGERGLPSPLGSAVKLRYSELSQEFTELLGRCPRPSRDRPWATAATSPTTACRARLPLVVAVHDRGGHVADPAQPDRRAHPRPSPELRGHR